MAKIQYEDKVALRTDNLPVKHRVTDADLNEIKESVNFLYDNGVSSSIEVILTGDDIRDLKNAPLQILPDLPAGSYYINIKSIIKIDNGSTPFFFDDYAPVGICYLPYDDATQLSLYEIISSTIGTTVDRGFTSYIQMNLVTFQGWIPGMNQTIYANWDDQYLAVNLDGNGTVTIIIEYKIISLP